jgi:hypothetical protein
MCAFVPRLAIGNIQLELLDHATSSITTFFENDATLALFACIVI